MIESNIVKRFIVKTFMQNSGQGIQKIAEMVINVLSSRLMLNENVIIPSRERAGKIVKCSKGSYTVQLDDGSTTEAAFQDLQRRLPFDYADVCHFLECITIPTPLGRIVIENVFEKISQPGFGARKPYMHPYERLGPKTMAKPVELERYPPVFQDVEYQSMAYYPHREECNVQEEAFKPPEIPKLDFKTLKKFQVGGFEGQLLPKLINVYSYFRKFQPFTQIVFGDLESFSKEILDSEYSSDLIMSIHKFLVECVEKDVENYGMRFINDISMIIKHLPDQKSEVTNLQAKKRVKIDANNWKAQIKAFLHNLSIDTDSRNVLALNGFMDSKAFEMRLDLISFLMNMSYFTDTFRTFVQDAQNQYKSEKAGLEVPPKENGEKEDKIDPLDNPLKTHIGRYGDYILLFIDRNIILKHGIDFYILDLNDAKNIMNTIDPFKRTGKCTLMNLKGILQELSLKSKN